MTKRLTILLLFLLVLGVLLPFAPTPVCAMTGSGTAEDPYLIYNVEDLQAISLAPGAYYKLANSIDASATATWNWDAGRGVYEGFVPISTFAGDFEGNYCTISNLCMNWSGVGYVGLFGDATNAYIRNVYILGADVSAYATDFAVGIVAGYMGQGVITQVITSGTVYGFGTWVRAGGILGGAWVVGPYSVTIRRCASYADVTAATPGGYAGSSAGGLVGYGSIAHSYNCYARGTVTSSGGAEWNRYAAGGFLGLGGTTTSLDNCYATGYTTCGSSSRGGLVGRYGNLVTDSFWDLETTACPTSDGGTGKNTTDMKTKSTFTDAGWDFDTIWAIDDTYGFINDGYPYFLWGGLTTYTLTISSTLGGNVTYPGEGTFVCSAGTVVSLNATPDTGYEFYRWTGDTSTIGGTYNSSTNITMDDNYTIVANFQDTGMLPMPVIPLIKPAWMEADPSILPWYDLIHPAAVGLEWRTIDLWGILIIFIAVGIGVGVMIATGSTLLAAVAVAIVLSLGVSMCVLSWWIVIVYAIFSGSYLVAVRTM